jgi:hypothetical protein
VFVLGALAVLAVAAVDSWIAFEATREVVAEQLGRMP